MGSESDVEPVAAKGKAEPLALPGIAIAPRARFGVDVFQKAMGRASAASASSDPVADALSRARAEREPQLVTLVGVPGIGKSRLVVRAVADRRRGSRADLLAAGAFAAIRGGVAFWALGEMVKAQAGILESDGAVEADQSSSATVGDLVPESDTDWVERHLRPLRGARGDADPGQAQRAEAFAAWRRFFEALGARSPAVLIFEDLQWADDGLLDFSTRSPTGSPACHCSSCARRDPSCSSADRGGRREAQRAQRVAPSPHRDGHCPPARDPARTQRAPGRRTGGPAPAGGRQPSVRRGIRAHAGGRRPRRPEVPETLQGVVAARIDALSEDEKGCSSRPQCWARSSGPTHSLP